MKKKPTHAIHRRNHLRCLSAQTWRGILPRAEEENVTMRQSCADAQARVHHLLRPIASTVAGERVTTSEHGQVSMMFIFLLYNNDLPSKCRKIITYALFSTGNWARISPWYGG